MPKTIKRWKTEDEVVVLALKEDGDGFALVVNDDDDSPITLATDVAELDEMIAFLTEARDILLRLERAKRSLPDDEEDEEEEEEDD